MSPTYVILRSEGLVGRAGDSLRLRKQAQGGCVGMLRRSRRFLYDS